MKQLRSRSLIFAGSGGGCRHTTAGPRGLPDRNGFDWGEGTPEFQSRLVQVGAGRAEVEAECPIYLFPAGPIGSGWRGGDWDDWVGVVGELWISRPVQPPTRARYLTRHGCWVTVRFQPQFLPP